MLYVTEQCVFRLTEKGMVLIEIAPGVDIENDIFKQMEFEPIIDANLRSMDPRIFEECSMGLKAEFARA